MLVRDGKLRERDSLSRPERELSDDALRAMAITFSDLDGPETLDAALKQRGDPLYAHMLYEAPRQSLHREGTLSRTRRSPTRRSRSAARTIATRRRCRCARSRRTRRADSPRWCSKASRRSSSATRSARRSGATRTIADAPEVAAQLKSNQKDLAEYHHAQAQKSKKAEDYTAAARWYRAMLDSFPQDPEAPATRYLLAEVLFESGRFAEAAREYERTAYDYPLHAKSAAAGYAALDRVSEARADDRAASRRRCGIGRASRAR